MEIPNPVNPFILKILIQTNNLLRKLPKCCKN